MPTIHYSFFKAWFVSGPHLASSVRLDSSTKRNIPFLWTSAEYCQICSFHFCATETDCLSPSVRLPGFKHLVVQSIPGMSHLQKQRCAEAILLAMASDCTSAAEVHLFHHIQAHTGLAKFSKHLSLGREHGNSGARTGTGVVWAKGATSLQSTHVKFWVWRALIPRDKRLQCWNWLCDITVCQVPFSANYARTFLLWQLRRNQF